MANHAIDVTIQKTTALQKNTHPFKILQDRFLL